AIGVIWEGFGNALVDRGFPDSKVHALPNWVDADRYKPLDPSAAPPAWDTARPAFRIVYAGNMGLAQGLGNLLEAAARMPRDVNVRFVLIGDGVEAAALRADASRRQLSDVEVVPFPQPEAVPAVLAAAR